MTENAIMAIAASAPFVALFLALGIGDIGKPAAEAVKARARADVEIERLRLDAERLRLSMTLAADQNHKSKAAPPSTPGGGEAGEGLP